MAKIETEQQYNAACARVEELLKVVGYDTPNDNQQETEYICRYRAGCIDRIIAVKLLSIHSSPFIHPVFYLGGRESVVYLIKSFKFDSRLSVPC